jgi:hypothetical protein
MPMGHAQYSGGNKKARSDYVLYCKRVRHAVHSVIVYSEDEMVKIPHSNDNEV